MDILAYYSKEEKQGHKHAYTRTYIHTYMHTDWLLLFSLLHASPLFSVFNYWNFASSFIFPIPPYCDPHHNVVIIIIATITLLLCRASSWGWIRWNSQKSWTLLQQGIYRTVLYYACTGARHCLYDNVHPRTLFFALTRELIRSGMRTWLRPDIPSPLPLPFSLTHTNANTLFLPSPPTISS